MIGIGPYMVDPPCCLRGSACESSWTGRLASNSFHCTVHGRAKKAAGRHVSWLGDCRNWINAVQVTVWLDTALKWFRLCQLRKEAASSTDLSEPRLGFWGGKYTYCHEMIQMSMAEEWFFVNFPSPSIKKKYYYPSYCCIESGAYFVQL
jgi:hypothetical protein